MNRIVLIGNGFDLAHGLESDYKSFLNWYWTEKINFLKEQDHFEDDDAKIVRANREILTIISQVEDFENEIVKERGVYLEIKNGFLLLLSRKSQLQNWIDIEHEYFLELKRIATLGNISNKERKDSVVKLNQEFERIKVALRDYLTFRLGNHPNTSSNKILNKIYSNLSFYDISNKGFEQLIHHYEKHLAESFQKANNLSLYERDQYDKYQNFCSKFCNDIANYPKGLKINRIKLKKRIEKQHSDNYDIDIIKPNDVLLLNFNYTPIIQKYRYKENHNSSIIINIHGELDNDENPMIFGYGDEIGADYAKIEELNVNEFLENVKSIRYSDTNNYKKLLEFVESDSYQIMIMGHSCGNSDRTLLNTLFEHPNCVSIKFYYYKNEKGEDNYSDVIRNISRNFNNKTKMRERVVNKMFSEELIKSDK